MVVAAERYRREAEKGIPLSVVKHTNQFREKTAGHSGRVVYVFEQVMVVTNKYLNVVITVTRIEGRLVG